jgi:hypothetical protein
LGQHLDVVGGEVEDRLVVVDVEIGRGRVEQDRLLLVQEVRPPGLDLVVRLADGRIRPATGP